MNELYACAQDYARRGWLVLPLRTGGKTPLTQHGLKDAAADLEQILDWWRRWPQANVGVRTGSESGFFVLDIDGDAGKRSLLAMEQAHGEVIVPDRMVATGGGGLHYYFDYDLDDIKNFNDGRIGDGLDVRGAGGYVVAPPSVHETGRGYEWVSV